MPKVKLNNSKLSYSDFKEVLTKPSQEDRLFEQLKQFEKIHKMPSSIFFEKFQNGKLPDEHEFSVWASVFRVYTRLQARGGGCTR